MLRKTLVRLGLAIFALGVGMLITPKIAYAQRSGGGGGGGSGNVDTIKVIKCESAVTGDYVELLISASSSNSSAYLDAYLPSGEELGEVQNGAGGRYGGTVFITLSVPESITITSSYGGSITVPCVPYQP